MTPEYECPVCGLHISTNGICEVCYLLSKQNVGQFAGGQTNLPELLCYPRKINRDGSPIEEE